VLKWFDLQKSSSAKASQPWLSRTTRSDARIAKAVEDTHPERAIAIYLQLADSIASETKPKTYPEAGSYLKRIRPLLKKAGREGEWPAVLEEFRKKHGRKPRLMQVIDGISSRPIVKRGKS
jgi:uncharacterized Zn finger protein